MDTIVATQERVARFAQAHYAAPRRVLRSKGRLPGNKHVAVLYLLPDEVIAETEEGGAVRRVRDLPDDVAWLRELCEDAQCAKIVLHEEGVRAMVDVLLNKHRIVLINAVGLANACDPNVAGMGFCSAQYTHLQELSAKHGAQEPVFAAARRLLDELFATIGPTLYWSQLGIEALRLAQTAVVTGADGQLRRINLRQHLWQEKCKEHIMHQPKLQHKADQLFMWSYNLSNKQIPTKLRAQQVLPESNSSKSAVFLHDEEIDFRLPLYPPFFHRALPLEHFGTFSDDIDNLITPIQASEDWLTLCDSVRSKLENIVREFLGKTTVTVRAFGSTVTQLGFSAGDLDCCIVSPESLDVVRTLRGIAKLLRHGSFPTPIYSFVLILHAKVPIIKFVTRVSDPKTNRPVAIACDLSASNTLALHNSELLSLYRQCDVRVKPMVLIVKYWAKKRNIHDASKGKLSSYALTLMVIAYMQHIGILPYLQCPLEGLPDLQPVKVDDWNTTFHRNLEQLQLHGYINTANNHDSVGLLLAGFFHYYAFEFNFSEHVVNIRKPGNMPRSETEFKQAICVQDPFLLTHNTAKTSDDIATDIMVELRDAYNITVSFPELTALLDTSD